MDEVQSELAELKFDGLEVNGQQVLATVQESLNNDLFDRDEKRKIFGDMVNFLGDQKNLNIIQTESLQELKALEDEGLNFTKEQIDKMDEVFRNLEGSKIEELKSRGTLDSIDSKMGSLLVSSDDLKQTLEETRLDGKSLKDILSEGLESELGSGITDLIFGSLGLPGIGTLFTGIGGAVTKVIGMVKGIPAFFSKIFKPVGKALKAGGKILKVAGKFAKAIPVVGTIIAAAFAIFDAISGFFNASEISGKSEEMLTIGDKLQASLSNVLSGLTFGFFSAEEIFQSIEKAVDFFFGENGILGKTDSFFEKLFKISPFGLIVTKLDMITGGTGKLFGKGGLFPKMADTFSEVIDDVTGFMSDGIDSIKNFFVGENGIFTVIGNFFDKLNAKDFISLLPFPLNKLGESLLGTSDDDKEAKEGVTVSVDTVKPKEDDSGFFDRAKSFFSSDDTITPAPITEEGTVSPIPQSLGTESSIALQKEEAERNKAVQSAPPQPQMIPVAVDSATVSRTPRRESAVDDMRLSAMNLSLVD